MTEHRSAGGSLVRAKGSPEGVFTARAVSYNTLDSLGSVWAPGCFTASLNQHLPVIAWGHDWTAGPIGRATSWRDTAQGPEITARLDNHPDVPVARQAIAQIASGTLTDVSVGFSQTKRREPTKQELQRWPGADEVIISATLDELSIVLVGAVPGAELISMRSTKVQLQRDLARGRISPAQYRARVELDEALDAALDLLAGKGIIRRTWRSEGG